MLSFYLGIVEDCEEKITLEYIYNNYKTEMYCIAFDILKDSGDAEDAVHDAFLLIARNIKKISGLEKNKIFPYILAIVRNVSLQNYNKNKKSSELIETLTIDKNSDDTDIFEDIDYKELVKAIADLPPMYRDIMYLFYLDGMSAKEIAKHLKISVNAVWKRNEYAKKLLREKLKELGIYV